MDIGFNMNGKNKILTFLISLVSCFLISFGTPEKQMEKVIKKEWKGKEVKLTPVSVPDSVKVDISYLSGVTLNKKLLGYVCYTTAYGCRIGGCAGPTTPNAQSYETFDYIIVYNSDLKIRKVDIANYGGEYGYEICRPKWLKQFEGSTTGFNLNENIDGITGATVSATYLIESINHVGKLMKKLTDEDQI